MDALEGLYATLPEIGCQGFCARSCGPIPITTAEAERMVKASGADLHVFKITRAGGDELDDLHPGVEGDWLLTGTDKKCRCPLLRLGRCTIYETRPAICRLWGLVPAMRCMYGCEPERWLTNEEGVEFLKEIGRLS